MKRLLVGPALLAVALMVFATGCTKYIPVGTGQIAPANQILTQAPITFQFNVSETIPQKHRLYFVLEYVENVPPGDVPISAKVTGPGAKLAGKLEFETCKTKIRTRRRRRSSKKRVSVRRVCYGTKIVKGIRRIKLQPLGWRFQAKKGTYTITMKSMVRAAGIRKVGAIVLREGEKGKDVVTFGAAPPPAKAAPAKAAPKKAAPAPKKPAPKKEDAK